MAFYHGVYTVQSFTEPTALQQVAVSSITTILSQLCLYELSKVSLNQVDPVQDVFHLGTSQNLSWRGEGGGGENGGSRNFLKE